MVQYTKVGDTFSSHKCLASGVIQGSCLLFVIHQWCCHTIWPRLCLQTVYWCFETVYAYEFRQLCYQIAKLLRQVGSLVINVETQYILLKLCCHADL